LSGQGLSQEVTFDTDHGHFMLEGIPSFDLWVDMTHYGEVHHKSSDTIDKVDAHNLAAGAAIVAVTAYALAERPTHKPCSREQNHQKGEAGRVSQGRRRMALTGATESCPAKIKATIFALKQQIEILC
jgi:hypothetical protein